MNIADNINSHWNIIRYVLINFIFNLTMFFCIAFTSFSWWYNFHKVSILKCLKLLYWENELFDTLYEIVLAPDVFMKQCMQHYRLSCYLLLRFSFSWHSIHCMYNLTNAIRKVHYYCMLQIVTLYVLRYISKYDTTRENIKFIFFSTTRNNFKIVSSFLKC